MEKFKPHDSSEPVVEQWKAEFERFWWSTNNGNFFSNKTITVARLKEVAGEAWVASRHYAAHQPDNPIALVLFCPVCQTQHIDQGQWASRLHRTHLCEKCKTEFRPCNLATVGVATIGETGSQPDSGEPNRRKSKYGVLVGGEPLENLEQAIPAEPPASPAGDAVATDNLRPNSFEIEPKPPVGDEQALSCGEAWIRYSQDVLMYRFGGKAESANDWDRLQHSFDAGWNAATAQLRQDLQIVKSRIISILGQKLAEQMEKRKAAETALAQAGEQALRDAAKSSLYCIDRKGSERWIVTEDELLRRADDLAAQTKTKESS